MTATATAVIAAATGVAGFSLGVRLGRVWERLDVPEEPGPLPSSIVGWGSTPPATIGTPWSDYRASARWN